MGELVLAPDAEIARVGSLPESIQVRLASGADDYVVSLRYSRGSAVVVDAGFRSILEELRRPGTVVSAVARHCQRIGEDAESFLVGVYPLLLRAVRAGILVPAETCPAEVEATFRVGQLVEGFQISALVWLISDTEVYRVTTPNGKLGALKLLRRNAADTSMLSREDAILRALAGAGVPRVFWSGLIADRPAIALEWVDGSRLPIACRELRRTMMSPERSILELCHRVVERYAALHERGVLHGDVHGGNVLVDHGGMPVLVDFGFATFAGTEWERHPRRGGVAFLMEPEFASAKLAGRSAPCVTPASEQFAVAATLYHALTGENHINFSLARETVLRQIVEGAVVPPSERGLAIPGLDDVLTRALARRPEDRFPSMRVFASAIGSVLPGTRGSPPMSLAIESTASRLVAAFSRKAQSDWRQCRDLPPSPKASVNYGLAGVAFAAYRVACSLASAELLSIADLVGCAALDMSSLPDAFLSDELRITSPPVSDISLYHSVVGVHCVQAIVAIARGDTTGAVSATQQIVRAFGASVSPSRSVDLTLGVAGALVGCAILVDAFASCGEPAVGGSLDALDALRSVLIPMVEQPLPETDDAGVAHGSAGVLYGRLLACRASSIPVPAALADGLLRLAAAARIDGGEARWMRADHFAAYMPGWCNGAAGHALLWVAAYESLGDSSFLELAVRAATAALRDVYPVNTLCCGAAGAAYASLAVYRATGEGRWVDRAKVQFDDGVRLARDDARFSLYKGELGLTVLAADLARPESASMPLFELERFARGSARGGGA